MSALCQKQTFGHLIGLPIFSKFFCATDYLHSKVKSGIDNGQPVFRRKGDNAHAMNRRP